MIRVSYGLLVSILDNILRSQGGEMSQEQRSVIESYKAQVDSEFSSLLNREKAPADFTLPEDVIKED